MRPSSIPSVFASARAEQPDRREEPRQAGRAADSAVAGCGRCRVPPPGLPRRDRHAPPDRAGRGVPRGSRPGQDAPSWSTGCSNSSEFVDYWAYKWSDLLLVSSQKLPAPAMWSFYRFVRESVAKNVPWDQFARSIVTAQGSTLSNGAANFFVLHRDPIDLTEKHEHGVPRALADLCSLPQSSAGEMDAGPVLRLCQPVRPGQAQGRRDRRRRGGGECGRRARSSIRAEEWRCRRGRWMARRSRPDDTRDRRAVFADWLARPDNPYFARAVVNRVWSNFFGRGLVDPEDDLRVSNPPSDRSLARLAGRRFRRPSLRHQAPDQHDHDLGGLRAVELAGAGQRVGYEVPEPLSRQAAAGRGPARRDRPGHRGPDSVRRLSGRLADAPVARQQGREHVPRLVRPAGAAGHVFVRAVGRAVDGPGPAPGQRDDDQREAPLRRAASRPRRSPARTTIGAIVDRLFLSALSRRPTSAEQRPHAQGPEGCRRRARPTPRRSRRPGARRSRTSTGPSSPARNSCSIIE